MNPASAAIDGWSDPILPPVERTLSEYQRPSQLSMAPITRGLGASPGNLILVGRILPVIPVFLYRVYTPLPNAAATAKNALILSDADTATSSTTKLVAVSSLPHGQVILQLVKGVHKASESARVRSYISSSPAKLD